MEIRDIMIAFIVAGLFVTVGIFTWVDGAQQYNQPIPAEYDNTLSLYQQSFNQTSQLTNDMQGNLQNNTIDPSGLAMMGSMVRGTWTTLKMIWAFPTLIHAVASDAVSKIGINPIFLDVAMAILILIILFVFINSFMPQV